MLRPDPFFDRADELAALERCWSQRSGGQMAMVYGRRRVGKTYLLQQYFSSGLYTGDAARPHCYYLAEQSTAEFQRLKLAERLLASFPTLGYTPAEIAFSWHSLLRFFAQRAAERTEGRISLILDEFPYLAAQTPELPSILQAWWDQEGTNLPVFLILCGSQLSFMESLGRETEPLFGRMNPKLKVEPLRYDDVESFYRQSSLYGPKEQLLMYGILGGTPRYHAKVNTDRGLAEEVVDLLLRPGSPLENEVRFLLSSEQIRDPAPHNAILSAIARGNTQYGHIQNATGIDSTALAHPLRTLQDLNWILKETSFGETSEKRGLYRIADPFLHFWYRFVGPLSSALQFSDPSRIYAEQIEPFLADYMGWRVFESICIQWLQRNARDRLGLAIHSAKRYWSRDGLTEIDIVAELANGRLLFGECKWSSQKPVGIKTYADLRAKVSSLPERKWRDGASFILFSFGGFSPELHTLAAESAEEGERLYLVDGDALTSRRIMPGSGLDWSTKNTGERPVVREKAMQTYGRQPPSTAAAGKKTRKNA